MMAINIIINIVFIIPTSSSFLYSLDLGDGFKVSKGAKQMGMWVVASFFFAVGVLISNAYLF